MSLSSFSRPALSVFLADIGIIEGHFFAVEIQSMGRLGLLVSMVQQNLVVGSGIAQCVALKMQESCGKIS